MNFDWHSSYPQQVPSVEAYSIAPGFVSSPAFGTRPSGSSGGVQIEVAAGVSSGRQRARTLTREVIILDGATGPKHSIKNAKNEFRKCPATGAMVNVLVSRQSRATRIRSEGIVAQEFQGGRPVKDRS